MARFYVPEPRIEEGVLRVEGSEVKHIRKVLRLKTGDRITIFDGLAKEYEGKIKIGKLNVDENPVTAGEYAVMSIPTLKLFKNGKMVDEWRETGLKYPHEYWANSCYGMCQYLLVPWTGTGTQYGRSAVGPLKTSSYFSPQTTILCQDSAEQKNEGGDDTLGLFPGYTTILDQWSPTSYLQPYYPGVDLSSGWWRHGKASATLWVPGNVSRIRFVPRNVGIDYRCYTGERPERPPKL